MTAQPGWYADPSRTAPVRWWDGEQWTRWLSRDPAAAPPGVAPTLTPVEPEEPLATAPAPARRAAAEPTVGLPVAVAVVVGTLLVAVVGLGAVARVSEDRLPSGPALAPPAAAAAAPLTFDPATRAASVGELQVMLPGPPYTCSSRPEPFTPAFASVLLCSTAVHEDIDGRGGDWSATAGAGILATDVVVAGDVQQTADQVFAAVRSRFFAQQQTTVTNLGTQPTGLTAAARSTIVTGEVRYRVPGVPSRYDRVVVVVVALADGRYAAVVSARPEKTPTATLDVLDASLASIRVR